MFLENSHRYIVQVYMHAICTLYCVVLNGRGEEVLVEW